MNLACQNGSRSRRRRNNNANAKDKGPHFLSFMLRQLLLDVVGGFPPDQLEITLVSTTVGAFDAHGVLKIFGLTLHILN